MFFVFEYMFSVSESRIRILFGRKKVLLIFGGRGDHDDDDDDDHNSTGVDSTPVNCGEDYYIIIGRAMKEKIYKPKITKTGKTSRIFKRDRFFKYRYYFFCGGLIILTVLLREIEETMARAISL